ncbi:hypothetical protein BH11MYX2_BH11MYX2_34790 [soil metagenome]
MLKMRLAIASSLLASSAILGVAAPPASAAPAKKKYHFDLAAVTAKDEVKADVAKEAQPRIEAQVKKQFANHPQLVGDIGDAPNPDSKADAYRKYIKAKGVSGSYLVTVEITEASIEIVPEERKPGTLRISVHVGVHFLGENVPGRTMGFTGDGSATIKQEVGMKVRDKDREYTWDQAAEVAVDDAMKTVFKQLAVPQKKQ